jgi:hypothetical protein
LLTNVNQSIYQLFSLWPLKITAGGVCASTPEPNVFELSDTPKGRKPGAKRAVFARTRR